MSGGPEFTLHDLLDNAAARDPDRIAIIDGDARYTYGKLARAVGALCAAFLDAGVRRGDRIGIWLEKSWEAVVAPLAASRAGAAFVNLNPLLKPRQVRYIAQDCAIRVLVADAERLASLEEAITPRAFVTGDAPRAGDAGGATARVADILARGDAPGETPRVLETDLGAILYTSGSTGLPKGVALSQRNLVVGAQIVSTYLENHADDRILSVLPFSFDYGLNQLTTALRVGATLVLQRARLPGDLLRALRAHRITGLAGVPAVWVLLLQSARSLEAEPLTDLRYITNSGGRVPTAHVAGLRRSLPTTKIYLMYGLTEAFRSTFLPPSEIERGSECLGTPVPNTEIWVLDESGKECAPDEVGELVHRGPTVALGYWGREEETRRVFRPSPFAPPELDATERVVYSGDLARRDAQGYLYLVGRRDALIKLQGYRISPEEVEDLLVSTGFVREACAFGVADAEGAQRIVAVVSLRADCEGTEAAIRAACLENAPPYLVPGTLHIADDLPKTPSGKVDRQAIRDAYADR